MPTFEMDGRHIYFESHGQGRPLVLLNGIMMSCVSWQPFVEALSANNRLILVDFTTTASRCRWFGDCWSI